ncbi:hypothetical protein PMI15_00033 [Polaromonas sp. CF318]|uniref:hypothetical protein n=1 Tax=Polaromonas sp. CF318 TaxID=1144318 RepID=UPI000270E26B|nr:hypothetical protein [Polaromonas sp. CF318]EJL91676.1 hypothetical protein PMI15_00033 [Polaromonas sp. CF318]
MAQQPPSQALFAVLEYGEFPELLRIAEAGRNALAAPPLFFFAKRGYRRLAADSAEVVARGFQWLDADGRLHEAAAPAEAPVAPVGAVTEAIASAPAQLPEGRPNRSAGRSLLSVGLIPLFAAASFFADMVGVARTLARDLANFSRDRRRFRRRYQALSRILESRKPSLLVVGQDGVGSDLSFLLIAAGRLDIPRLIAPFAMFSLQETADYAGARPDHDAATGALNRLVARMYPHWLLRQDGRKVLRLPGYRALALETSGLIHGKPWTPLSEPSEAVTADSKVAADTLESLGLERSRLHVIGSPVQDLLARKLDTRHEVRERLSQAYGFDVGKPLLLCGWPVNMFAWLGGRPISYASYEELAAAWAQALKQAAVRHGVNVIVSVHPKTLDEEYAVARTQGLACQRGGVEDLVAACDAFTTLNGSSITSWAIACGKPTLLFDCFLTRYRDFLEVPGCINVESAQDFSAELHKLCGDAAWRETLAQRMKTVSADWGQLDGQAGARVEKLLAQIVSRGSL